MKPTVEAKNICFNYHCPDGETEVIKDLSFSVDKGEFVSIVGPSGCGNAHLGQIQLRHIALSVFHMKHIPIFPKKEFMI